ASIASESSLPSTDPSFIMDSALFNGETQQQILKFKRHIAEMQHQLKQIRRTMQMNMQASRDILRDAFDRVQQYITDYLGATPPHPSSNVNETLKSEHIAQIANLQKSLQ
ncbi:unnamed protein product, partial [Litomosoides sigmodontis]